MRRPSIALAFLTALQGCATPPSVVFDPATMASVSDSATGGGFTGATFFILTEVNGKPTDTTSQSASHRASFGKGAQMQLVDVERPVIAGKVTLKITGSADFGAPAFAVAAAIFAPKRREIEGTIEVELKPDARYRVTGALDELRSEVWLEDATTHAIIGNKIVAPLSAEAIKALKADVLYSCCNFHYDDDGWISDANWFNKPFVAAGAQLRVYDYGRDRAKAMVNGRPMWLGLDYGLKQQTIQQFIAKQAVKEDPRPRIAGWPEDVRAAIASGKVVIGMSKEQAIVSLGYPRADTTRSLDMPRWAYGTYEEKPFALMWDAEQRLMGIEAAPDIKALVLLDK